MVCGAARLASTMPSAGTRLSAASSTTSPGTTSSTEVPVTSRRTAARTATERFRRRFGAVLLINFERDGYRLWSIIQLLTYTTKAVNRHSMLSAIAWLQKNLAR